MMREAGYKASNDVIYEVFAQRVADQPDCCALVDQTGSLSYQDLDHYARELAMQFPRQTHRVGIVLDHGRDQIATILAVLSVGGCYVPVEPGFPLERIGYMMREACVDFLITHQAYSEKFSAALPSVTCLTIEELKEKRDACAQTTCPDREGEIDQVDQSSRVGYPYNLTHVIAPTDPAYILYTSGSTGKPKGVEVLNGNVCNYARAFEHEFHIHAGDRMLQYSVCSFDIFVEEVFATLLNGATLVIPSKEIRNDLGALVTFLNKMQVTIISGFPYLLQACNERDDLPQSLRLMISGGDVLRAQYVTNLINKIPIYNTYGPSETCVCATYCNCSVTPEQPDGTYPIGRPVLGVSIQLLDDHLQPVRPGEVGEIVIFGNGVSAGYIGDRAKENQAFITWEGQRAYRSGDLGVELADGQIHFLHRRDDQVMILGKRVEPGEVENVISQTHEVKQTYVDPETDAQGLTHLIAYIVPEDETFMLGELKHKMAAYLPAYMIPEDFVVLQSLPLTPNGKVDKSALLSYKQSA